MKANYRGMYNSEGGPIDFHIFIEGDRKTGINTLTQEDLPAELVAEIYQEIMDVFGMYKTDSRKVWVQAAFTSS